MMGQVTAVRTISMGPETSVIRENTIIMGPKRVVIRERTIIMDQKQS